MWMTNGIVKGVSCGFVYWVFHFHGSLDRLSVLHSGVNAFVCCSSRNQWNHTALAPSGLGANPLFVVVRRYPLTDKIDCCTSVAHIGIQRTQHPTSFLWGGEGGLWFINFYVYPVMRGFQELTRWFPESRLSLSTLHLSILRAIRTGRPKYFSYLHLLKWSLLRAIYIQPGKW